MKTEIIDPDTRRVRIHFGEGDEAAEGILASLKAFGCLVNEHLNPKNIPDGRLRMEASAQYRDGQWYLRWFEAWPETNPEVRDEWMERAAKEITALAGTKFVWRSQLEGDQEPVLIVADVLAILRKHRGL